MTKADLIKFLEPFTPEIVIISEHGSDLNPKYMLGDEGEGFVVLTEQN